MNHRERVLTALEHKEPDRVPVDLGASVVTSIAATTYKDLRKYLNLPRKEVQILETTQQIAMVDEDVIERFQVDIIPVLANPPTGYEPNFTDDNKGGTRFTDEFGAILYKPNDSFYYDWREFPIKKPSLDELEKISWPDPEDPGRYKGLRESVEKLREETDFALFGMAPCGHDLFNQLLRVRGMEEGLMDLLVNAEFAEAFLDKYEKTILRAQELFLDEVGDLIDIHFTADDLTGQSGPLISPEIYRQMIKPRWARIISLIKSKTKAKVFYHGCGAMREFIPDLIEIGVDILNPVQISATGMDTAELKKKYGEHLCFWGGGCDTQKVLQQGSPQKVQEEVKRRIKDLAPGGGFVFNPVHNIQPLVPLENIVEMFDSVKIYGKYPISVSV